MKKLLLGSVVLTAFAIATVLFQLSCKKDATAQTASTCTETGTVNLTITIPAGKTVVLSQRINNNATLERKLDLNCSTFNSCQYNSDGFYITYDKDFREMGTASTKTFTFKNVIPGIYYYYGAFIYSHVGSIEKECSTIKKEITVIAGQTYDLALIASDFTCN